MCSRNDDPSQIDEELYQVIRFFYREDLDKEVVLRGLTLKEAQEHCKNPETNSRTATSKEAKLRTEMFGPWFDGYEVE